MDGLQSYHVLRILQSWFLKALLILMVLLFVKWGRNLLVFVFSKLWKFIGVLPGKKTKEMIGRYLNIGRYAFHKEQLTIFE
ncbi:MAG: hypothetical protein M3139_06210 [Bacteroidota bacterium]|nr:hypothetical protein [Bacteroidota bacterium]